MERRRWLGRRNRDLTLVALLLFMVVVGVGAAQRMPGPHTVSAQRIVLVDAAGIEQAVLSAEGGGPMLTFRDRHGEPRLRIGMLGDEAHVDIWDQVAKKWRNRMDVGVIPAR